MPFNLTLAQIEMLLKIEKNGTTFSVRLRGGQIVFGKNFFYLADQIKQRFDLEVTALQLEKIFDKDKS
tara:strand:+ start:286 stop:489 length:204 start_codon:yes stop_codon:yes gene_type:complete